MTCAEHTDGCGLGLQMGELIVVDATECELAQGKVYYIAARRVTSEAKRGCKVGYVKCLFNQVKYFAHRVGLVTAIEEPDEKKDSYHARNKCDGIATLTFVDAGMRYSA